eukprot:m.125661 g.125661  ORF g.125661 m.125661 type:complete len:102 (-) comp13808_c1_seq10:2173-2478(-)
MPLRSETLDEAKLREQRQRRYNPTVSAEEIPPTRAERVRGEEPAQQRPDPKDAVMDGSDHWDNDSWDDAFSRTSSPHLFDDAPQGTLHLAPSSHVWIYQYK